MHCNYNVKSDCLTMSREDEGRLTEGCSNAAGISLLYVAPQGSVVGVRVSNFITSNWTGRLAEMAGIISTLTGATLYEVGRALRAELC